MMMHVLCAAGALMLSASNAASDVSPLPPLPTQQAGAPMATLPFAALRHGQRGVCYTVFEGDTVEPFAFEIKSIMPKYLGPDDDLLLVRLLGDKAEFTGVVSGMSGSPCLVDNKLIGALSYSFANFAKEPIAGITPIAAMNRVQHSPKEARPYRIQTAAWPTGAHAAAGWPDAPMPQGAGAMPTPITTPLGLAHMVPEVRDYFAPYLRAMGFEPMATGSLPGAATGVNGGAHPQAPTTLVPGGAIAVVLAQGDINMAATGTVTAVQGNQILAFGHPFTGGGAVSFPMAPSYIVNTMASSMHSFKMAVAGAPVGEINGDRLPAIAGTLGAVPAMVPLQGTLRGPTGAATFAFEVARDPVMTPRLLAMGTANALTARSEATSRGTGRVTATIRVAGHEPVVATFVEAHPSGGLIFMQPSLKLFGHLRALWDTDFPPPGPVAISLEARLAPEPVTETIDDITFDQSDVRPGARLTAVVHLRGAQGELRREQFILPIPPRWSGEDLEVVATGGDEAARFVQATRGPSNPQSYGDVLSELRARPEEGQLYLFVVRQGQTLRRGGRSFGALPPSALALLGQASNDAVMQHSIDFEGRRPGPGVVRGLIKRSLFVGGKSHIDRASKAAQDL